MVAMKLETVKLNLDRTINLGNYESLRIDIELGATLDENENLADVVANMRQHAKLEIAKIIKIETKKNQTEDYY